MSIKETLKKLAAGASVVSMATSFGCGNKKEEVEKEPAPVVETVNPNRQATKEDYKEFCESMVNTDRLVDYDSKTNTCHVIDRGDMIKRIDVSDTRYAWTRGWHSNYAAWLGCYSNVAAIRMHDLDGYGITGNKARIPCYVIDEIAGNVEYEMFPVEVSFTNKLLSIDEYIAKVCKTNNTCKCKKGKNGKESCEIVHKQPFVVDGNAKHYGGGFSLNEFIGDEGDQFPVELSEEYDRIEEDFTDLYQIRRCPNDARKFCVKYSDAIIVKFDDLRFIDKEAEYRKCEDQCAKQNSIPSVKFFDFVVGKCECEITDGMYDNCKIKCADQGSKPVQQRRDFDGNCKCKAPKESASLKQAQGKKLAMVQSMFAIKGM